MEMHACRLSNMMKEFHYLRQGSSSVDEYYTKLKILFEEMQILRPLRTCISDPTCKCGAIKDVLENLDEDYMIQFVEGLNENFEHLRSQVLMMVPLPTILVVLSMATKYER